MPYLNRIFPDVKQASNTITEKWVFIFYMILFWTTQLWGHFEGFPRHRATPTCTAQEQTDLWWAWLCLGSHDKNIHRCSNDWHLFPFGCWQDAHYKPTADWVLSRVGGWEGKKITKCPKQFLLFFLSMKSTQCVSVSSINYQANI